MRKSESPDISKRSTKRSYQAKEGSALNKTGGICLRCRKSKLAPQEKKDKVLSGKKAQKGSPKIRTHKKYFPYRSAKIKLRSPIQKRPPFDVGSKGRIKGEHVTAEGKTHTLGERTTAPPNKPGGWKENPGKGKRSFPETPTEPR